MKIFLRVKLIHLFCISQLFIERYTKMKHFTVDLSQVIYV